MSKRLAGLALVAVCLAGPAMGQQPGRSAAKESGNPADRAFANALRETMTGLRTNNPSGEPDQDFARMIMPYHQGMIAMAKAELRYGRDEGLKALARDIVTMHEKEIALMKAWEDRRRGGH